MTLVDQAILPDDLFEQALVRRTNYTMAGRINLGEESSREWNKRALADIDEERRLPAGFSRPLRGDLNDAIRQRRAEFLHLRRSVDTDHKTAACNRSRSRNCGDLLREHRNYAGRMPDRPREVWLGLVWEERPYEVTGAQWNVVHTITGIGSCGPHILRQFRPGPAASRSGRG
jgi:hypothetical protein